jgi:hypothetical protein
LSGSIHGNGVVRRVCDVQIAGREESECVGTIDLRLQRTNYCFARTRVRHIYVIGCVKRRRRRAIDPVRNRSRTSVDRVKRHGVCVAIDDCDRRLIRRQGHRIGLEWEP